MNPVPIELPVRAGEAGRLAELIFELTEGRKLTDSLRSRLANRVSAEGFQTVKPLTGSLARDPVHQSVYYVAAEPDLLLRMALETAPSSGLFPNALLIGRLRTSLGRVAVVNAIPFGADDRANIRTFAESVDPDFLPRTGVSGPVMTCDLEAAGPLWHETVWHAIRVGWRQGWVAELRLSGEAAMAGDFTRFSAPASVAEAVYDFVRQARERRTFDFALELEDADAGEAAEQLRTFRAKGKPVQFLVPAVEPDEDVAALLEVARQFNVTLTLPKSFVGKSLPGKINYRGSGGVPAEFLP